mgnify:CR=1 FL=1
MGTEGKDFGKAIGEKIGASLKRMKEESERAVEENSVPQEDLNILPMPDDQEIFPTLIRWTWFIQKGLYVCGVLYTQNQDFHNAGDYVVEADIDEKATLHVWTPEVAKEFGVAAVSASNWVNVWQQHFGHLFAKKNIQISVTESDPDDE